MSRVMIAGASGFVGRNLARCLAARHEVIATHHTGAAPPQASAQAALDLLAEGAIEPVLDRHRPDVVINAAGNKNVRFCQEHPAEARAINALAVGRLAAACAARGIGLVQISTDLVFDGDRGAYREDERPHPATVYGRTKLEGEEQARKAHPGCLIARTGGVYGPESPLLGWLRNELDAGREVECFEDVRNTPTLVDNLAEMLEAAMDRGIDGLLHTVGREPASRHALFLAYARAVGLDAGLLVPRRAGLRRKEMLLAADASLCCEATRERLPGVVFNDVREGCGRLAEGEAA